MSQFGSRKKVEKKEVKKVHLSDSEADSSEEEQPKRKPTTTKKADPKAKPKGDKNKKWKLEDSDDSEAEEQRDDITCMVCKSEADVFCFGCKGYLCINDFSSIHTGLEGGKPDEDVSEPAAKKQATEDKTLTPAKSKDEDDVSEAHPVPHKFRALVGLESYRLASLSCGWDVSASEPQRVIYNRRKDEERHAAEARQRALEEAEALSTAKRLEEERKVQEAAVIAKRKADAEYEVHMLEAEIRRKTGVRIHGWKEDERTAELWAKAKVFKAPPQRR